MNVALKLSADAWGQQTLCAELAFEEPVKVLSFAWWDSELWWAKSSNWSAMYSWSAQYHHCRDGTRQVIVGREATIQGCVIPPGFEPEAAGQAHVALLKPSVLFRKGAHGLGVIVVPRGAASAMRNHIWRLKPALMNPSLEPFELALSRTRTGHMRGFMPGQWD